MELKEGDRVRITDTNSDYFNEIGEVELIVWFWGYKKVLVKMDNMKVGDSLGLVNIYSEIPLEKLGKK